MAQKTDTLPDYMKIKSFHLFLESFLFFKNKKKYDKVYPKDADLAHFLSEQFETFSNKNFDEQVDLFSGLLVKI